MNRSDHIRLLDAARERAHDAELTARARKVEYDANRDRIKQLVKQRDELNQTLRTLSDQQQTYYQTTCRPAYDRRDRARQDVVAAEVVLAQYDKAKRTAYEYLHSGSPILMEWAVQWLLGHGLAAHCSPTGRTTSTLTTYQELPRVVNSVFVAVTGASLFKNPQPTKDRWAHIVSQL